MLGYSAAHDDEQETPQNVRYNPSATPIYFYTRYADGDRLTGIFYNHSCPGKWWTSRFMAAGEVCPDCLEKVGQYAPGMVLVTGGENGPKS